MNVTCFPVVSPRPPFCARERWLMLIIICLGVLMMVLDATVVNVALSSIRRDLQFTDTSLVWVVSAYMLTYGGSLMLGGRLGDLYGHRPLFLAGIAQFTLASLACGVAGTQELLIAARAMQGLGAAVVASNALALIVNMFTQEDVRARAVGIYSFVTGSGGTLGLVLGGTLTTALNWRWIFLVNLPIGVLVYIMCFFLLPRPHPKTGSRSVDVPGVITLMASLILGLRTIINGNEAGWASVSTVASLSCALALFVIFAAVERYTPAPLLPLTLLRLRSFALAMVIGALWSAGIMAWTFSSALYMQRVLGYQPIQAGLAFLPANLLSSTFGLGLSAAIVKRFGISTPLLAGLLLGAAGLMWFTRAPVTGRFLVDILPGMVLLGSGAGIAYNALMLAAMSEVRSEEAGIASGILSTSLMVGGSLGLAILTDVAAAGSRRALSRGAANTVALTSGYHEAFLLSAFIVGTAAILSLAGLRRAGAVK